MKTLLAIITILLSLNLSAANNTNFEGETLECTTSKNGTITINFLEKISNPARFSSRYIIDGQINMVNNKPQNYKSVMQVKELDLDKLFQVTFSSKLNPLTKVKIILSKNILFPKNTSSILLGKVEIPGGIKRVIKCSFL